MTLGLLDIGPVELLILTAAAVMLFGGDLPDMARRAGRILGRMRAAAQELTRDLEPPHDLPRLPDAGSGRREDRPEPGDPHASAGASPAASAGASPAAAPDAPPDAPSGSPPPGSPPDAPGAPPPSGPRSG